MVELSLEETRKLKEVVNGQYSRGPFLGMIYNNSLNHPDMTTVELVKKAMEQQLEIDELVKTPSIPKPPSVGVQIHKAK